MFIAQVLRAGWRRTKALTCPLRCLAVARDAGIADVQDAFSLPTYFGAESTGALPLLPPGTPLPNTRMRGSMAALVSRTAIRMSYSLCRFSQKRGSMLKNGPRRGWCRVGQKWQAEY